MKLILLLSAALLAAATPAFAADGEKSAPGSPTPKLTLAAPVDYQVIQRQTLAEGRIPVSGTLAAPCDKLELRLEGKDMNGNPLPDTRTPVALNADHTFKTDYKSPAGGWYSLTLKAYKDGKEVAAATVPHVGVGEVFVGAGQSNSTNCGGLGSKLATDGRTQSASGMVASFNGSAWRLAHDPQWGTHDFAGYQFGSFWPAFGDAMNAKFKVPVGVAVTGHGGTNLGQWGKGAKDGLYNWTLTRMNQLGKNGFRAVLWHQGESDYGTPARKYADSLEKIITDFRQDAGWNMPWFVAHASYCPQKPVVDTNSRGGQKILWDKGVALEGPDTDAMLGDLRDHGGKGIHFSKKGLKAHGEAWADKVAPWLEQQLTR